MLATNWVSRLRLGAVCSLALFTLWWSFDRGALYRTDEQLRLDVKVEAAPLVGRWIWQPTLGLIIPLLIGVLVIWKFANLTRRLSFAHTSIVAAVLGGAFSVTLAGAHGWSKIMDPVVDPSEYWVNLDTLPRIGDTIRQWSDWQFLLDYTVHLKGHPPGFIVMLQLLESIGLGDPWVFATLCWLGLAAVIPAVMASTQKLTDTDTARTIAPFLILSPYAIWMATSADAFYACILVWGIALLLFALDSPTPGRRISLGVGSGALLGFALFCTYGAATFMVVPAMVLLCAHRIGGQQVGAQVGGYQLNHRVVVGLSAAAMAGAITLGFRAAGFWWFDGLNTTQDFYHWGTAQFRPWQYFIVANIAALIIAVGPAVVVGLARLGRSRLWVLVGAGVLAIAAANLSNYSKAEVERIWVIFMPLLIPVTFALPKPRLWLAGQLALGLLLQAWLSSKW
jgi:methylthioxylose transferase